MSIIAQFSIGHVGDYSRKFLDEGLLIIFPQDDVMSEVKNYCILADEIEVKSDILINSFLYIDEVKFKITAIGSLAQSNLETIGHITIKADGSNKAKLPGTIHIEKKEFPEITKDARIEISDI